MKHSCVLFIIKDIVTVSNKFKCNFVKVVGITASNFKFIQYTKYSMNTVNIYSKHSISKSKH